MQAQALRDGHGARLSLTKGFWGSWRFAPREPGLSQFRGSPRLSESKPREESKEQCRGSEQPEEVASRGPVVSAPLLQWGLAREREVLTLG